MSLISLLGQMDIHHMQQQDLVRHMIFVLNNAVQCPLPSFRRINRNQYPWGHTMHLAQSENYPP